MPHEHTIRELIHAVRRRWLTLRALRAIVNASLSAAVVLGIALTATMWTHGAPRVLAAVAISAVVLTMAAVVRGTDKPVIVTRLGAEFLAPAALARYREARIPVFVMPDQAVRTLRVMADVAGVR